MTGSSLRKAFERLPGAGQVQKRLDRRTLRSREDGEDARTRAKERWRDSRPDAGLTWGKEVSGTAFIEKAASHGAFGTGKAVVEIGPGYGRLVRAALDQEVVFDRWVGVDLSQQTVDAFNHRFDGEPVKAVMGDAESIQFGEQFDTMLSSLTLKHIFPTFERALTNVASHLKPGGRAIFDLIEGEREYFQRQDGVTFIRHYSRDEAADLVERSGLELVEFDAVDHDNDPTHRRLLVVTRRPDSK
jgi:SAM-dependent methyltransferase